MEKGVENNQEKGKEEKTWWKGREENLSRNDTDVKEKSRNRRKSLVKGTQ